ncbi:MAG: two-component regulator propeller domain-containing protein [Chryseolinea sp.]
MVRYFLLVLAFCLPASTLFAQKDFFSLRNYTAIDGLPQSQVMGMVEDKCGYLWIGTEGGGLAHFDGREFKVYTTLDGLLSNLVKGIRLDSKDNLWILHPRGVTRFDGLKFKTFQDPNALSKTKSLRNMYLLRDTLFVISGPGLTTKIYQDSIYYWEKDRYDSKVFRVHTAANGQVILLLDGHIVVRTASDSYVIPLEEEFGKLMTFFNFKGNVVAQTSTGEFTIDLNARKLVPTPMNMKNWVVSYDEKADAFWTSNGSALCKINSRSEVIDTVLSDVKVSQVLNDSEGNTWFASDGKGLFKYFNQDFVRCSSDNLRSVNGHLSRS